ncbi:MAG TPA: histidine--tRNA ligase [Acidimicrobiales bacterium]|nr:histidine--tRNA ligase [Acidimicrobiales bacterium]
MPQFQAPPGTFDVLPPASARYQALVARFAAHVEGAGYGLVMTPMFEDVGVFERVGEATDVVSKEMYDFRDKGDRHLALRPEGTASVVRAFVQHHPLTPWKAWYMAPNFRQDRPQKGRYRQHHQVGVEAIGTDDPDLDAEVVALAWRFYATLGLTGVELRLNSMGDEQCMPAYRRILVEHLAAKAGAGGLCDEHRPVDRYSRNPLRVLDCKKEPCREATVDAPGTADYLCPRCMSHFGRVRAGLDSLGVAYTLDFRLVRGFDYYTRTAFEFVPTRPDATQNAIGGGGRYDGLAEALGGASAPGIGFGLGIERILIACDAEGVFPAPTHSPELGVFVIDTTGGEAARDLSFDLRAAGIAADRAFDNRSWKAQMKQAQRSGARLALVVEPDGVTIRTLQEKGEAEATDREHAVERVRSRLAAPQPAAR